MTSALDAACADRISDNVLDELEIAALKALVGLAADGNASAASNALVAIQRIREKGAVALHREALAALASDGAGMSSYLSALGLSAEETAARLGRKLKPAELAAWKRAQEDRLLEVRAVELQRMRVAGEVPAWANRRHKA